MKGPALREYGRAFEWEANLKSAYGLTVAEYVEMWRAQKGLCAICGKPETAKRPTTRREGLVPEDLGDRHLKLLSVDHDHNKTGREAVRGLLCHNCNWAISRMDSIEGWAEKATGYLMRFKKERS